MDRGIQMTTTALKPWDRYKGEKDWKRLVPGWCGELTAEDLDYIQQHLMADRELSFSWGYRPGTRRRSEASIRKVALLGSDESRSINSLLIKESARRANGGPQSGVSRVTKGGDNPPLPKGRPRKTSWESELVKLAKEGWGCKRIAAKLKADGVPISHMTVARRLAELPQ